jgi:hypothetical protein
MVRSSFGKGLVSPRTSDRSRMAYDGLERPAAAMAHRTRRGLARAVRVEERLDSGVGIALEVRGVLASSTPVDMALFIGIHKSSPTK